jgi:hypothetical protein
MIMAVVACLALGSLGAGAAYAASQANSTKIEADADGARYSLDDGATWTEGQQEALPGFENAEEGGISELVETITDGDPITDEEKASAINGGEFKFDGDTTDITVFYAADGTVRAEDENGEVVDGGTFTFDGTTNDLSVQH